MKKKGFTLVELLAVIIILVIIVGLVVIKSNQYYSSRTNMDYDNLIKIIIENTRTMLETSHTISDKVDKSINRENNASKSCMLNYQVLVDNNYMDSNIKNPKTNNLMSGYIKIGLSENYEYLIEFVEEISDETSDIPECVLTNTTYAISFNSNGGTGGQSASVIATPGDIMPTITTTPPAKSGYIFKGWFDQQTGGKQYYSAKGLSVSTWDKNSDTTLYARWSNIICRRATSSEIHSLGTYIYGQVGTTGQLNPGDAFVCDVNADDNYDPVTEMFYYVSDYYVMAVGSASSFNSNYATLIYSNNTYNGLIDNITAAAYYSSSQTNLQGPVNARSHLPTTNQWPGVSLYYTTRYLQYSDGGYYKDFSYDGYAARMLTYNELLQGCPSFTSSGSLSSCKFLLENGYGNGTSNYTWGYWLETAELGTGTNVNKKAISVLIGNGANGARVVSNLVDASNYSVRPTIDVKKTNISY